MKKLGSYRWVMISHYCQSLCGCALKSTGSCCQNANTVDTVCDLICRRLLAFSDCDSKVPAALLL